jgi:O-antigen/teichoic acid export membrane protein
MTGTIEAAPIRAESERTSPGLQASSLSSRIVRNTAWTLVARLLYLPVSICLIPFIISKVGIAHYGIWVTLFAVVDYFSLFDFGNGAATIRHVAHYHAAGEPKGIGQTVTISLLFNIVFIPPLFMAVNFSGEIISLFQIDAADRAEAVFILRWVIYNFAVSQLANVFRSTMIGQQRIHIVNYFDIAYLVIYAGGTVYLLNQGAGLSGLVRMLFFLRSGMFAVQIGYLLITSPEIRSGFGRADGELRKRFFAYGMKLQFLSVAGLVNSQLDKLLIGHFLRIEFVAFYEIGQKLSGFVRYIPSVLLAPLIPASTELHVQNDRQRLQALCLEGTRYMVLLAAPVSVFFAWLSPAVIELWLQENAHAYAALSLRILAMAFYFDVAAGAISSVGRGTGALQFELQAGAFSTVLNAGLSIALILCFGFPGALVGTAAAMILMNSLWLHRFGNHIGAGVAAKLWSIVLKPLGCAMAAGAFGSLLHSRALPALADLFAPRVAAAAALTAAAAVFLAAYGIGLAATRMVSGPDLRWIAQALAGCFDFRRARGPGLNR